MQVLSAAMQPSEHCNAASYISVSATPLVHFQKRELEIKLKEAGSPPVKTNYSTLLTLCDQGTTNSLSLSLSLVYSRQQKKT
jgi:hypothetical protein